MLQYSPRVRSAPGPTISRRARRPAAVASSRCSSSCRWASGPQQGGGRVHLRRQSSEARERPAVAEGAQRKARVHQSRRAAQQLTAELLGGPARFSVESRGGDVHIAGQGSADLAQLRVEYPNTCRPATSPARATGRWRSSRGRRCRPGCWRQTSRARRSIFHPRWLSSPPTRFRCKSNAAPTRVATTRSRFATAASGASFFTAS